MCKSIRVLSPHPFLRLRPSGSRFAPFPRGEGGSRWSASADFLRVGGSILRLLIVKDYFSEKTGNGIQIDMPQFNIGDFVSEKAAMPKRVGRVVQIYDFDGETRFVVLFEDGSVSPFFAFELVAEKI